VRAARRAERFSYSRVCAGASHRVMLIIDNRLLCVLSIIKVTGSTARATRRITGIFKVELDTVNQQA
jgi:hypothetical protein